jgi:RHS repeat-associated protein
MGWVTASARVGVTTTNYTLDMAGGLTQVLLDGTYAYLYGVGRITQESASGELYFLADSLGSVRQIIDASGSLQTAKSYEPYGDILGSIGDGTSNYGFTNEYTSQGLIYLRARWYSPQTGLFISKDPWDGNESRPSSYNKWQYSFANPTRYTDHSGLVPTHVECDKIMLLPLANLCKVANMDDQDPSMREDILDAREKFFWWIVRMSYAWSLVPEGAGGGEGYWYAGKMLENFLRKSSYVRVNLMNGTRFDDDPGIMRATWKQADSKYGDEPNPITPLLYKFLQDYIQQNVGCEAYQVLPSIRISGKETYSGINDPRPQTVGWWGAFGHVIVDAEYTNISITKISGGNEFIIRTKVNYHVADEYKWFGGQKETPLPLGFFHQKEEPPPFDFIKIPHTWEDSLVAGNRGVEYPFDIYWSDYFKIYVPSNFSQFLPQGKDGWIPLQ